jgi:hypothetical protein
LAAGLLPFWGWDKESVPRLSLAAGGFLVISDVPWLSQASINDGFVCTW